MPLGMECPQRALWEPAYLLISAEAQCTPDNTSCRRMITKYDAVMQEIAQQWGNAPRKSSMPSHDIQFDDLQAVTAAIDDVLSRAHSS